MEKLRQGLPVWVKFGKQKVAGTVLEWAWASQGDYQWVRVELEQVNALAPAQTLRQVYPHPVQSYRLTHRKETPEQSSL